jgi:hypothetical protein
MSSAVILRTVSSMGGSCAFGRRLAGPVGA